MDRLRIAYGVDSDARLVEAMASKPQTVSTWRARGRLPAAVALRVAAERGVSAEWLMHGGPDGAESDGAESASSGPESEPRGVPAHETADDAGVYRVAPLADPRLDALVDWLAVWWAGATDEQRAWLIVEMQTLRGRLLGAGRG